MKIKSIRINLLIVCLVSLFGLNACGAGDCSNVDDQSVADLQSELDDANAQIVELQKNLPLASWVPLLDLATYRNFADLTLVENLEAAIGDNDGARQAIMHLMVMTPSQYDRALWPSLLSIARLDPTYLETLRDLVKQSLDQGATIANAYIDQGAALGMTAIDLRNWLALAG